jgi:alkylation response protein AidB-like acyl-CoA dehydrogenase
MAKGEMLSCFCLTGPQADSDAAAISTWARRHGNRWVLTGSKQFISSREHAQIAIVFAVTDPERSKIRHQRLSRTDRRPRFSRRRSRALARPARLRHGCNSSLRRSS